MKLPTYQTDFWRLMNSFSKEPFDWGAHDCATFACLVHECVTGLTLQLQVSWKSETDARRVIENFGGLRSLVEAHLGTGEAWGRCGMGDLVLCSLPTGEALAVHDGTQLMAPGPKGLRRIPFELAVCGWIL